MLFQKNKQLAAWLGAFRLRTLPLSLSSIILGYFLAISEHKSSSVILVLTIITTVLLQILSNLANDYGDAVNGADTQERVGPQRMVQSGIISKQSMYQAIIVFTLLSLVSGIILLLTAFEQISFQFIVFLLLGILAIGAAIKYTAGKNPYGYAGLGDISVLLFFGIVGVAGSYFLQTKTFNFSILLPAFSSGLLATAVLNINNLRDIETDKKAGKRSIPVRIGYSNGLIYQIGLVIMSFISCLIYTLIYLPFKTNLLFFIPVFILLFVHTKSVVKNGKSPNLMNKLLKQMALISLLFSFTFGIVLLS